jgi:hypothetical protein
LSKAAFTAGLLSTLSIVNNASIVDSAPELTLIFVVDDKPS